MNFIEAKFRLRMQNLIEELNKYSDAYYNGDPIVSDAEYDSKLKELEDLEKLTNTVLSNSPTIKVGAEVSSEVKKIKHEFPAKSLDKTKDVDDFANTFKLHVGGGTNPCVLMWKLDGSTIQLTYRGGELISAATRGDGYVGQDITEAAKFIDGIPVKIPLDSEDDTITVRGEAVISYTDFNTINESLDVKYKNPRNLASSTITMLDPTMCQKRKVRFKAFQLVSYTGEYKPTFFSELSYLSELGFDVVPCRVVLQEDLKEEIGKWNPEDYMFPVDGLVAVHNDIKSTKDLKGTEHHNHPLKGYAFKWSDERFSTTLIDVYWSPSRSGRLNPVAIFNPVEIDGTIVSRASLHNLSIMKELKLHKGDTIEVYKANKIIPQVYSNLDSSDDESYSVEDVIQFNPTCPSCNTDGRIVPSTNSDIFYMTCPNPYCKDKVISNVEHFCSRSGLDIEGLSRATIEKFYSLGILNSFSDIFKLHNHKEVICRLDGFGEKSYTNLIESIEASKSTTIEKFLSAISIPGIGVKQSKDIAKKFNNSIETLIDRCKTEDYSTIEGFGSILNESVQDYFNSESWESASRCIEFLKFESSTMENTSSTLSGNVFVITGKLNHFSNRKELEEQIEANGGKIASSVTKNTTYLINNDITSTSSKNKKAKELNIPIITEAQLLEMIEGTL